MNSQPAAFDPRALRSALACFPTGVTIITTLRPDGGPVGLTVNSFASVSLDPPLILWSLVQTSPSLHAFRAAHRFCVNVLAGDQEALCMRFASKLPDKFADIRWRAGEGGVPVLEECLASFECSAAFNNWGGDHVIFVGRVERFETRPDAEALMFHHGRLMTAPSLQPRGA